MRIIPCPAELPAESEVYISLKEPQLLHYYEPDPGLFIAESPQVIRMALEAGYRPESFLLWDKQGEGLLNELLPDSIVRDAVYHDIPVYLTNRRQLCEMAGCELTGGALAAFRRKPLQKPEDLIKNAKRIVCLEEVMNPRNIGSIFRSAAAIGYDAVLLTKGSSDPLYRRSARVSMGTVFQIPWTFTDDLSIVKDCGFITVAMALTNESVSMDDPVLKGHEKLAVLMGSERNGLKPETICSADYTARIPMKNGVDSLNVAAASAIAFWELREQC